MTIKGDVSNLTTLCRRIGDMGRPSYFCRVAEKHIYAIVVQLFTVTPIVGVSIMVAQNQSKLVP